MCRKLVLVLALVLCLFSQAKAINITYVTESVDYNADGTQDDIGWVNWLQGLGYTVAVQRGNWATLDATKIATLNAADLIIVSRMLASANYANDATEISQWNALTKPLIQLNAYLLRGTTTNFRWYWVNSGTTVNVTAPVMEVVDKSHPIFTGITIGANNQVAAIDATVGTGQVTFINTIDMGNGKLLAKTVGNNYGWIAEWQPGVEFYTGSGQKPGAKRLMFSGGTQEVSGSTTQPEGAFNLTDVGKKMLSNAILYMLGLPVDPGAAVGPKPANTATDLSRNIDLSWTPGQNAATHDVYLGTSFSDVNAAGRSSPLLVSKSQDANTYDPGSLQLGLTYYWRIDEIEQSGAAHKGIVWSFTIEPVAYPIAAGITATASSVDTGSSAQNTVNKSGLTGDLAGLDTSATQWLSAVNPTRPVWIEYDLGALYKLNEMWVWNSNSQFEWVINFGLKSVMIEYSANGTDWAKLGDYEFAQATSLADYAHNSTVNFTGVAARKVRITANSNYGGKQYGLSEVRFYYIPVSAREPNPTTGSTGIAPDVTLSWRAGREAVSHQVFMGTDPNVLTLAGTSATNSFAPANLSLGTKYYWRVDEVNTAATPTTWASDVWSFTTSAFITVDDMESYNDTTNQIFNVWVDGYGTTTNGATVGLTTSVNGTFGSTTIFHGGRQSMPLAYNNTGSITNSEATRTFDSIQDWTKSGVKTLSLYFRGQAGNITTVPLWVKLTDQSNKTAKVIFGTAAGEDTLVLADPAWTTWNIPLSSFTGVNTAKIKSMTIGLGNGTGTGTLYIDDIRLYPAATTTTITPTLVGWWKLDNDVKDSSGNGNDGTIVGTPTYVAAGKIGASLKLNGTTDYVDCGNGASLNITDVITCSAWIKPANFGNSAYQTFISKGDVAYVFAQTSGNQIQFVIYDGTWYSANSAAVTSAMNISWHHVAGTYDGTQVRLYVDGKMAGSVLRTGVIATDTYVLSIGRNSQQASRLFNGEMDDVRIYHGVLSTSDIVKLANP